jgi:hypothetical protein
MTAAYASKSAPQILMPCLKPATGKGDVDAIDPSENEQRSLRKCVTLYGKGAAPQPVLEERQLAAATLAV